MKILPRLLSAVVLGMGLTAMAQNIYTIYPIPQQQVAGNSAATFTNEVTIVCDSLIDKATRDRALSVLRTAGLSPTIAETPSTTHSNIFLAVSGSNGTADHHATALGIDRTVLTTAGKYDRHIVHLTAQNVRAEVTILGESSDATFYGLASLEQMLENGTTNLPTVTINDYADQQSRGLVEGYYGYPYSVNVKKDLMQFMMRMKMNTYLYGAKSDVYHSALWEQPYPTSITPTQEKNGLLSQSMMREITAMSAATKVNFIWAIHPGNAFVEDNTAARRIMQKFSSMYDLGVRQFAIFVDDVGVPTTVEACQRNANRLTAIQDSIDKRWNTASAPSENQVKPLHFVPQVYTLNWVAADKRKIFFNALKQTPNKITIYITGANVWSVPNSADLAVVKEELGRNVGWWWNYPCNDNADEQIYPSDMYFNFKEMRQVNSSATLPTSLENGLGIVSNPMQQGEVSKTALFSVADYAWNNDGFNNTQSWEASFKAILNTDAKREAYKAVIPYIRWNEPTEMATAVSQFKIGKTDALNNLLTRLEPALAEMDALQRSDIESDRLLHADLAPWLAKLGEMVRIGKAMIVAKGSTERDDLWAKYVAELPAIDSLNTAERFKAYALEGLGHGISVSSRPATVSATSFSPFMTYLRNNFLPKNFFGTAPKEATLFANEANTTVKALFLNNTAYLNGTNTTIPAKGYVGLALKQAIVPANITIADTLLQKYAIIYSGDGKTWTPLTTLPLPEGTPLQYLAIKNETEQPLKLRLSQMNFIVRYPIKVVPQSVTPPTTTLGEGTGSLGTKAIIDNDPTTFFAGKRNQAENDTYTLTLATPQDIKDVTLYIGTKNDDYLQAGIVEVSTNGTQWTPLHLKGTTRTTAGHADATPYAPEVERLVFTGDVKSAKQVRLRIATPKTDKWLRLYDIQINTISYEQSFFPKAVTAEGVKVGEVIDQVGHTRLQQQPTTAMLYRLNSLSAVTEVKVYWSPTSWQGEAPNVEVQTADGAWTTLGALNAAVASFDLTAYATAQQLRLSWQGNTVPEIYEITETTDGTMPPLATGLQSVTHTKDNTANTRHIYDLNGRLLRTNGNTEGLPAGIYLIGSRKLLVPAH